MIIKINHPKLKDIKLEKQKLPYLLFKKRTLRNKKTGERIVEYENYGTKCNFYDFKFYSDFKYSGLIEDDTLFDLYDKFLGLENMKTDPVTKTNFSQKELERVKNDLKYIKENFRNLMPPSNFCKEFAWANTAIK
jgi:hypothetical protein